MQAATESLTPAPSRRPATIHVHREIAIQIALLPQRIRRVFPCDSNTADAQGIGIADSGQRYVVKASIGWHQKLPASEWICHGLAKTLNLAIPDWEHCILPDGRDAIGSRLEGNILEREFIPTKRVEADNPEVVSGTYVLDLFVANGDRHKNQWLITEAGGGILLRPIDFSRAWFWRWPLPTPPFGHGSTLQRSHDKSSDFYVMAKRYQVLDTDEAMTALNLLRNVPKGVWRSIVESVPAEWLTQQEVVELVNWWWSPQWHTRISWIRAQL